MYKFNQKSRRYNKSQLIKYKVIIKVIKNYKGFEQIIVKNVDKMVNMHGLMLGN